MASDQQFCLRWNNHQSTLVSVFDNLLESQTLVDCTLAADGQYLKAHKVVLSACSPYLEAILCQNLDKHPILILKDVKFSELKAMLDYMYRGEVNISQEQLSTFLKAAESLQIKGLTDSGGGGGGGNSEPRDRDLLKRQDLRKPLNQPVPHIPQPRPVVPHPGLLEPRRSLPHFPPHIADMQPQSPRHAREGSTSPTARKRRRPNRPSSDDSNFVSTPNSLSENQPDTSDSCDVPVKQSAPSTPSNVPNPSTKAQETDSPRTTPQPQINSDQKQIVVKKEFPEALLTPKTELDYGNDNSMEDVNYEDDEDEEVDLSKPGTSFATNNQGFPPWQMGGDASNDDSNIYSPDVSASATQNNSQDPKNKLRRLEISWQSLLKTSSRSQDKLKKPIPIRNHIAEIGNNNMSSKKNTATNGQVIVRKSTQSRSNKRKQCFKCKEFVSVDCMRLHSKYYCGAQPDEKEWKLRSSKGFCLSCNKVQTPNVIEFHVKYLCGKKPITVQCFYCPNFYNNYRRLLTHMLNVHKKRHCYLDLMSILPPADPITTAGKPTKVVRHFFNNILSGEGKTLDGAMDRCLQVRKKTTYRCQSCGKFLDGIHAYQNHINTKCESERHYSCFFCSFKADLVYESLEHMESIHNQQFNTYDIIQAKLTGIIPTVDMATAGPLCEDVEVNFTKPESCELNTTKINDEYNKDQERNVSPLITYNKQCISQDCVLSKKRAVRANVKLTVAKRKVNIGIKNMRRGNKKCKQLIKKKCPKCCKEIHPTETRIHTKYHCNKEPGKNEWILKSGKALCLRCGKLQMSNLIDFHVMYGCSSRKKRFLIQCFYCTQIFREYRKLITHMKMAHNKSHYYADLMTILPDPDAIGQKDEEEVSTVIKHPQTYLPQSKKDQDVLGGSGSPAIVKFPAYENFHSCFYCAYKNTAGYKVLEHMQEVHGKNYNIYDLLEFKMVGNAKTKNI